MEEKIIIRKAEISDFQDIHQLLRPKDVRL